MWGFLEDVWDATTGFFSTLFSGLKWLVQRLIGILDFFLTLLGIMWPKKLQIEARILLDENKRPVADRDDVQAALDLAAEVFLDEMNVKVDTTSTGPALVPEVAPPEALEVECGGGTFTSLFTSAGAWFRKHMARSPFGTFFGYGSPVTVFVVRDVEGKRGCSPGPLADYVFIDPRALAGEEGSRLTLAHEVGHACDLWHDDDTLMQSSHTDRPRTLSRYQKAIFRSSPHVTYL